MDRKESERMEEMALEMIRFLQKWGLWTDASILTNGNRYSYSPDPKKCDCGLPHKVDWSIFRKYLTTSCQSLIPFLRNTGCGMTCVSTGLAVLTGCQTMISSFGKKR